MLVNVWGKLNSWNEPTSTPPPACLPIIGQSWLANCPEQHYSLGWICCGVVVAEEDFGGNQFLAFRPITDPLDSQIPVGATVLPYLQLSDTELVIDGKKYTMVAQRTPSEIIQQSPDIDRILNEAVEKMGISRRKAKKELYNQIIGKLKAADELKQSVFNDDEQIIMILVATDDI